MNDEPRAVAERYARRSVGDRYHPLRPAVWRERQGRQRALIDLLTRHAARPVATLDLLEIGCGHGDNLLELLTLGFDAPRLVGNELLPDRLAAARARLPAAVALHAGDAVQLPFAPASFDLVLQSTVFSSLFDDGFQQTLAQRMWSWVRPGGAVLWYDFTWNNPRNPDVRGVPMARVRALFPEAQIDARRVTLAPPLARTIGRWPGAVHGLLATLPFLRTHLLAWIGKP